jgi:hypothetical protein
VVGKIISIIIRLWLFLPNRALSIYSILFLPLGPALLTTAEPSHTKLSIAFLYIWPFGRAWWSLSAVFLQSMHTASTHSQFSLSTGHERIPLLSFWRERNYTQFGGLSFESWRPGVVDETQKPTVPRYDSALCKFLQHQNADRPISNAFWNPCCPTHIKVHQMEVLFESWSGQPYT